MLDKTLVSLQNKSKSVGWCWHVFPPALSRGPSSSWRLNTLNFSTQMTIVRTNYKFQSVHPCATSDVDLYIYIHDIYIYVYIKLCIYIYIYAHPAATSFIFLERISKLSETSWWQCFSPSFCKCTLPLTSPRTGTNCCAVGHHIGQHKAVLKLTLQGATLPQLFGGPSLGALR